MPPDLARVRHDEKRERRVDQELRAVAHGNDERTGHVGEQERLEREVGEHDRGQVTRPDARNDEQHRDGHEEHEREVRRDDDRSAEAQDHEPCDRRDQELRPVDRERQRQRLPRVGEDRAEGEAEHDDAERQPGLDDDRGRRAEEEHGRAGDVGEAEPVVEMRADEREAARDHHRAADGERGPDRVMGRREQVRADRRDGEPEGGDRSLVGHAPVRGARVRDRHRRHRRRQAHGDDHQRGGSFEVASAEHELDQRMREQDADEDPEGADERDRPHRAADVLCRTLRTARHVGERHEAGRSRKEIEGHDEREDHGHLRGVVPRADEAGDTDDERETRHAPVRADRGQKGMLGERTPEHDPLPSLRAPDDVGDDADHEDAVGDAEGGEAVAGSEHRARAQNDEEDHVACALEQRVLARAVEHEEQHLQPEVEGVHERDAPAERELERIRGREAREREREEQERDHEREQRERPDAGAGPREAACIVLRLGDDARDGRRHAGHRQLPDRQRKREGAGDVAELGGGQLPREHDVEEERRRAADRKRERDQAETAREEPVAAGRGPATADGGRGFLDGAHSASAAVTGDPSGRQPATTPR